MGADRAGAGRPRRESRRQDSGIERTRIAGAWCRRDGSRRRIRYHAERATGQRAVVAGGDSAAGIGVSRGRQRAVIGAPARACHRRSRSRHRCARIRRRCGARHDNGRRRRHRLLPGFVATHGRDECTDACEQNARTKKTSSEEVHGDPWPRDLLAASGMPAARRLPPPASGRAGAAAWVVKLAQAASRAASAQSRPMIGEP